MPHDRNGKLVEVGDIVMGRGYNIKHDIIGPVLSVTSAESCNLTVAIATVYPLHLCNGRASGAIHFANYKEYETALVVVPDKEYGATTDFEIIQKADGTDAA